MIVSTSTNSWSLLFYYYFCQGCSLRENPVFNFRLQAHWEQCCSHRNHCHLWQQEDLLYGNTCVQSWAGGRGGTGRHSGPRPGHDGHQVRCWLGEPRVRRCTKWDFMFVLWQRTCFESLFQDVSMSFTHQNVKSDSTTRLSNPFSDSLSNSSSSQQLCFNGECRNASFLRADECNAKCHGHGVSFYVCEEGCWANGFGC